MTRRRSHCAKAGQPERMGGCLSLRSDTSSFGCVASDLCMSFTHFGESQLTSSYGGVLLSFRTISPKFDFSFFFPRLSSQPYSVIWANNFDSLFF